MKYAMRPHPHADRADSFAVAEARTSPGELFVIGMHFLMANPLRSGSVRPSFMCEPPFAIEVSGRIGPAWVFEDKPVVEQTSRHHAAALQYELRLGLHEHGANLEHPPGCRKAHANARCIAQNSHEICIQQ